MILVASKDEALAKSWRDVLSPDYEIYHLDIHNQHALEHCLKKVSLDALIVDLDLLSEGGVHEISAIKALQPQLHVIVMAKNPDQREEISAILFGAKAYCSCDQPLDLLPKVVKTVLSNELWVDRKFVSRLLLEIEDIAQAKHAEAQRLDKGVALMTPRETQIASFVAAGASNRKIAESLNISERTVKAHLGVIFRKIGIKDRLQLALYMNRYQQLGSVWHTSKNPILDITRIKKLTPDSE